MTLEEVVEAMKRAGHFPHIRGSGDEQFVHTAFDKLQTGGWLTITGECVDCTPDGLMQIDRHLPAFFDPQYISSRYT